METPSTILILPREEVIPNLDPVFGRNCCPRRIPADNDTGKEEQRAAIFTGPIPRRQLELGVECQAIID